MSSVGIAFYLLSAVLLVAALGALLRPLLKRNVAPVAPDPDAAAVTVYRDQHKQLDTELATGAITAAEREASQTELAHRLAQEIPESSAEVLARVPPRSAWRMALAMAILVPVGAVLLYARLGNPGTSSVDDAGKGHEISGPELATIADHLAQKLKDRPDDAEGWLLLARSYGALGRFGDAAAAYARVDVLNPDNADVLADYADTLAMAQGQRLAGKPTELVRRALALEPQHKKALALAATAALEAGDLNNAVKSWQQLQGQWPEGSTEAQQIAAFISETEQTQRNAASGATALRPSTRVAQPLASMSPGQGMTGMTLSGRVAVSASLAPNVALSDTVFIFARAAQGTRMPVAVLRVAAKELPRDFVLDDSMAMTPAASVSRTPQIIVEARISKSGNALPQPGDLFGESGVVKPGASGLQITIDRLVP